MKAGQGRGLFSGAAGRVRLGGVVVLVIGWLAALAVVLATQSANAADGAVAYQIVGGQTWAGEGTSTHDEQQIARIGGQAAVYAVGFDNWLGSLWHGRRLAWTLAVLALVVAALCFHIAALMDEPVDDD